jgi:hypothetical protein
MYIHAFIHFKLGLFVVLLLHCMCSLYALNTVSVVSSYLQERHSTTPWMPETSGSTEPYVYYIFMMKFNVNLMHSKRLTTITIR